MMRAIRFAGVVLAGALVGVTHVGAQPEAPRPEMTLPRIVPATVDWDSARADIAAIPTLQAAGTDQAQLARLNAAAAQKFTGIEKSAVPVLLPVDPDALLKDKTPVDVAVDAAGFRPHFFLAGPAGYDAAFTLVSPAASDIPNFESKDEPLVLLSASAILYDLDAPVADPPKASKELEQQIPSIRRRWLESYLRYSFERYGVTYTASMLCTEGSPRRHWVSCADAANVLVRFVKSLRLAGGAPQPVVAGTNTIDRPQAESPDFTYAPSGKLIRNTGFRGHNGRPDSTVYAKIRFPLAQAPAYANSQSFMNWGNCDFTGRTRSRLSKATPYRCRVNDKPLVFDESAAENRSYPWRDNFCEHRGYYVGQCGAGRGHQGQDIRPATCALRNEGADRCSPFRDDIVAVRDGMLLRIPRRESVYLFVNAPGEHLRFRYLHMHPKMLDSDGVESGRIVKEGEFLGKVGNYDRIPNGTTYHLHFELQVPTRDGWVFVNPYMTLVAAYERLIGGRGRMVEDEEVVASSTTEQTVVVVDPAPAAATDPAAAVRPPVPPEQPATHAITPPAAASTAAASKEPTGARSTHAKSSAAVSCKAKVSRGRGGRNCAAHLSKSRSGAKRGVRKVGRAAKAARAGAGRFGRNLRTSDARPEAGYLGVRAPE